MLSLIMSSRYVRVAFLLAAVLVLTAETPECALPDDETNTDQCPSDGSETCASTGGGQPASKSCEQLPNDQVDASWSVSQMTVTEGDSARLRVNLDHAVGRSLEVAIRWVEDSSATVGFLKIPCGITSAIYDFPTTDNSSVNPPEVIRFSILEASRQKIQPAEPSELVLTINDDDGFQLEVTKTGSGSGTVVSSPPGIDCGNDCTEAYAHAIQVQLIATPAAGSGVTGWQGCDTYSTSHYGGTAQCIVAMTTAKTVTATFEPIPADEQSLFVNRSGTGTGTVTSSPTGINCGSTCAASFPNGQSVTLTATPGSGSAFTGWSGAGCSGSGTCTVLMDQARIVTATFVPLQYALSVSKVGTGTVTSTPAGINCGGTCLANYDHGTSVTLTASPSSGFTFSGWSGACSGTGTCTVSMTQARSVTATFNAALVDGDIAFSYGGDVNIAKVESDGSQVAGPVTDLATGAGIQAFPSYGCGATQIVYADTSLGDGPPPGPPYTELFKMNADGTAKTPILITTGPVADKFAGDNFDPLDASELYPALSPDGTKVLFSSDAIAPSDGVTTDLEIYVANIATGQVTQVTDTNDNEVDPAWSSDGTQITFNRGTDIILKTGLTIASSESTFATGSSSSWGCAGSSAAGLIAYENGGDVFVKAASGGSTTFTVDLGADSAWEPTWSPTGSKIAFASDRGGSGFPPQTAVFTVPYAAGTTATTATRVSPYLDDVAEPDWGQAP